MALSQVEKVEKKRKPSRLERFAQGLGIAHNVGKLAHMTGLDPKLFEFAKKRKGNLSVKDKEGKTPVGF